ncbi:cytochrome P450 [Mycena crocata]|nr:cytochrome P450 [Mycena crocata]
MEVREELSCGLCLLEVEVFKAIQHRHTSSPSVPPRSFQEEGGMDYNAKQATVLAAFLSVLAFYLVLRRHSFIRTIPGPKSPSWIFGHMLQLVLPPRYGDHEFQWQKMYGTVYQLKGCFGQDRLMVADTVALQHILNSPHFYRAPVLEAIINLLCGGHGVMVARGEEHRRLRAAMNVGFTAGAVRTYQEVFQRAAETLSEKLDTSPGAITDICPLLSSTTLAAISEAILGQSIDDLGQDFVENNIQIVALSATNSAMQMLADAIGAAFKAIRSETSLANRLGRRIVRQKVEAGEKGLEIDTDLFSLLLNPDTSDPMKRLSQDDVAAQTAVLLIAGQETTANTLGFALLELARHSDFQEKLRTEIQSTPTNSNDAGYENMPLLNACIKETLRLYPATPIADRVALQDTIIPFGKSIVTSTGEHISQIPVQKGQLVSLAIGAYQRLESRWGEDANEFNPYRWLGSKGPQGEAVGPYANLLSFLGGPRTCLGWRFAILEMQVILCEVVAKFSFAESKDASVRPRLLSNLLPIVSSGARALPLHITPVV